MIASRSLALLALFTAIAPAAALTGREVIDTAQQKNGFSTWKDRTAAATMDNYAKDSLTRTREMQITEQTDPRGEHRTFIAFLSPADMNGTKFLHLSPRGDPDQQWLWTPATRRVRRLGDAQRDENFFGADLSYRDLELLVRIQQWNDAESTATLTGEESLDGTPCHVVELVPKNTEFPYSKYRLWFGTDAFLLKRVEVFDVDGKLFKRVVPTRYERIQGYATALEAEVANVQFDSRTVFKLRDVRYDGGVSDSTFTVSNLGQS